MRPCRKKEKLYIKIVIFNNEMVFPQWKFSGQNSVKWEKIRLLPKCKDLEGKRGERTKYIYKLDFRFLKLELLREIHILVFELLTKINILISN